MLEAGGCKYELFSSAFAIIAMSIGHFITHERLMMGYRRVVCLVVLD